MDTVKDGLPDPLGARDTIVQVEELTRWNFTHLPLVQENNGESEKPESERSPFVWRNDLNNKIILWNGDITELNVHAIVHSTNERLSDRSHISEKIYQKAGPKLLDEVRINIKGAGASSTSVGSSPSNWLAAHRADLTLVCKTGEAKLTEGFNLICRHVIHTVGPRYNVKYVTAAEGALYSSYRNVLQLCRENSCRTLGLCCIHSVGRGYPPEDGAHIAIRTVRRFLERYSSDIDAIVFVCGDDTFGAYSKLLPLYFPRSPQEEEDSIQSLPKDIGNEMGEPVIEERQIRIQDKPFLPGRHSEESELEKTTDLNQEFGRSINGTVGQHAFAQMEENPDLKKRAMRRTTTEQRLLEQKKRYERLLKRAKTEDLVDIASLRCMYQTGQDRLGRPVVVFVGKNFPAATIDLEKALLYLIRMMDHIAEKEYVVVYFHTLTTNENLPDINFLKTVYMALDNKYRKNLKSFYIVHPTWWSKLATWFFTTFTASDIKQKVHSLKGVQFLYARINPDQLDIPPFVLDHDIQVNGPRYYVPFDEEDNGDL